MSDEDDEYLTIASSIPYVEYGVKVYKIIKGIYDFGRKSEQEKAIIELEGRLDELEAYVRDLDNRLSDLEVQVAQGDNRSRLRTIMAHQLAFGALARNLQSRPDEAADVAHSSIDRLRAMYEDSDLWLWNDAIRKSEAADKDWRPVPASFKGVPLPVFGMGVLLWALAAHRAIGSGGQRSTFANHASELIGWMETRSAWTPDTMPPKTISEKYRWALRVQIGASSKYANSSSFCRFSLFAVDYISRTRRHIRDVDVRMTAGPNVLCMADPRIATGDEAVLQDESQPIQVLNTIKEAVVRIQNTGSLADPYVGVFENFTTHELDVFGVSASGEVRAYHIIANTALSEPITVTPVGDILDSGWQGYSEVFGVGGRILYAFAADGSIDWYQLTGVSQENASGADPTA